MPQTEPVKSAHVLVIRLSAMGDVAMTVHAVKELRRCYPDIAVTVLTRPFFRPFFRDIDGVAFLEADFKNRHKGINGLLRLAGDISSLGVTHLADLHDVIRSKVIRNALRLRGLKIAVIDKGRKDKKRLTRKRNKILEPLKSTVERYGETFSRLGFPLGGLPVPVRSLRQLPEKVTLLTGEKTGYWIGLAPFAQHRGKIYPQEKTLRLAKLLSPVYERVFIFGGGPKEAEFARMLESKRGNIHSVIGKIELHEELDLISNLDLMICMDSSAMHMASLEGVPAVSVWGATHPYAGFYGFGQDPRDAVGLPLPCRPCSIYGNKQCVYGDYRCLENITPEMIMDRVAAVIERVSVGE